ncbi:hypothetical protein SEUCBS139899_010811 [Sporothrix eucalyptigena]
MSIPTPSPRSSPLSAPSPRSPAGSQTSVTHNTILVTLLCVMFAVLYWPTAPPTADRPGPYSASRIALIAAVIVAAFTNSAVYIVLHYAGKAPELEHWCLPTAVGVAVIVGGGLTSPSSPLVARGVCSFQDFEVANELLGNYRGKARLVYAILGGAVSYHTCKIINHYTSSEHPCADIAGGIAATTAAIIAIQMIEGSSTGVGTSNKRDANATWPPSALDIFVEHLESTGFTYSQVEEAALTRRSNDDEILNSFVVRDVFNPAGNATAADFHYTSFVNGTGYVHVIHETTSSAKRAAPPAGLVKRHDGAGFKYNWNRYVFNSAAYGANINSLSVGIGQGIAQDWAYDSDNFLLDQWIGAVGVDYILLQAMGVAIRIIPELAGFGEEYEDVGICGDMSGPTHDELR